VAVWVDEVKKAMNAVVNDVLSVNAGFFRQVVHVAFFDVLLEWLPAKNERCDWYRNACMGTCANKTDENIGRKKRKIATQRHVLIRKLRVYHCSLFTASEKPVDKTMFGNGHGAG
jgi:hypothetical protein